MIKTKRMMRRKVIALFGISPVWNNRIRLVNGFSETPYEIIHDVLVTSADFVIVDPSRRDLIVHFYKGKNPCKKVINFDSSFKFRLFLKYLIAKILQMYVRKIAKR